MADDISKTEEQVLKDAEEMDRGAESGVDFSKYSVPMTPDQTKVSIKGQREAQAAREHGGGQPDSVDQMINTQREHGSGGGAPLQTAQQEVASRKH